MPGKYLHTRLTESWEGQHKVQEYHHLRHLSSMTLRGCYRLRFLTRYSKPCLENAPTLFPWTFLQISASHSWVKPAQSLKKHRLRRRFCWPQRKTPMPRRSCRSSWNLSAGRPSPNEGWIPKHNLLVIRSRVCSRGMLENSLFGVCLLWNYLCYYDFSNLSSNKTCYTRWFKVAFISLSWRSPTTF